MNNQIASNNPWWKGSRGEWYVVGQIALVILVFFGPRTLPGWPVWASPFSQVALFIGFILCGLGIYLVIAGIIRLGAGLTAVPYPKEEARLIETGPYAVVRHPMYGGGVLLALGWALCVHGWLTLGYAVILFIFFDIKSRREEVWLREKYSGYTAYQRKVSKLIPYVY